MGRGGDPVDLLQSGVCGFVSALGGEGKFGEGQ